MANADNFEERSYQRHAEHMQQYGAGSASAQHARTWLDEGTVDYWRHLRMYRLLDPLLQADPGARWLTVGDGRYGKDAKYLQDHGADALATDISDVLLKESFEAGAIAAYSQQNAEHLSLPDASFDYAFCKESYHHFPRPALALYEMLRVARKAVVLVEPNDRHAGDSALLLLSGRLRALIKRVLGMKPSRHGFEDSGNYVFTISRRDIEKVALGLDYRAVAFRGLNDAFLPGAELERYDARGPVQRSLRRRIFWVDLLCRVGLMEHGLLSAIIFKARPEPAMAEALRAAGYEIVSLPENPYLNAAP
jgi:ubiquinone/menaquinone biosynthesis C-methylase UbiE